MSNVDALDPNDLLPMTRQNKRAIHPPRYALLSSLLLSTYWNHLPPGSGSPNLVPISASVYMSALS